MLWIAFIFQYLWDTKQLCGSSAVASCSCELLSFFSIFGIQNNSTIRQYKSFLVVNCFHFSVSLGYKTTISFGKKQHQLLWIAFIFQYLWDTKQPAWKGKKCWKVVNCFHFSVSLGYKTTIMGYTTQSVRLWIAFIFQYLWDTKQRISLLLSPQTSCELLSFFSIFGIQNNHNASLLLQNLVVNCFHFSVSLGYKTTDKKDFNATIGLWIAFIFQYLWDTKQQLK